MRTEQTSMLLDVIGLLAATWPVAQAVLTVGSSYSHRDAEHRATITRVKNMRTQYTARSISHSRVDCYAYNLCLKESSYARKENRKEKKSEVQVRKGVKVAYLGRQRRHCDRMLCMGVNVQCKCRTVNSRSNIIHWMSSTYTTRALQTRH